MTLDSSTAFFRFPTYEYTILASSLAFNPACVVESVVIKCACSVVCSVVCVNKSFLVKASIQSSTVYIWPRIPKDKLSLNDDDGVNKYESVRAHVMLYDTWQPLHGNAYLLPQFLYLIHYLPSNSFLFHLITWSTIE